MNDVMKIFQALEDTNILLKGVTKTIKNETKEEKGGFLSMLSGTLGASLLENLLSGKGIVKAVKVCKSVGGNINVKVDLSNYSTKTDLKNVTHANTSSFALKTNLASLKTEVDKLDIDKLGPVPVDLSKINDAAKNNVVKKTVIN